MKGKYRYIEFTYGTQGFIDTTKPLTSWKALELYSDTELSDVAEKYNLSKEGWSVIKIETKIDD